VAEENVAIVRAIIEADAMTSKEEILRGLPELAPVLSSLMRSGSKRPSAWTRRRIEATTASARRLSDGSPVGALPR
jgi:hypothetical protein